jgi:hypothetical protein
MKMHFDERSAAGEAVCRLHDPDLGSLYHTPDYPGPGSATQPL